MSQSSNPFLLPSRKKNNVQIKDFEPKRFKEWVNDLPVGNVSQTARLLYDKLDEMNHLDIAPVDRMRDLEAMMESLQFIFDALSKGIERRSLPLTKRGLKVAALVEKLYIRVIQAYKVVLDQFHNDSFAGKVLHKGSRAEALHRVFYFFGQAILHAYRLYRPAREHIWIEIHGLYHYAAESKLHDKLLDNEAQGDVSKSTVTDLYKQILLLSLAGPYRLQPGEISKVYHSLQQWVGKARLISIAHADPDDGLFQVDMSSDTAPKYRAIAGNEMIQVGWVLDTSGLSETLKQQRQQLFKANDSGSISALNNPNKISVDLLDHLKLSWGVGPQRSEDRVTSGGMVTVTCGLDTLYSLYGGVDIPQFEENGYRVGTLNMEERAVSNEPISAAHIKSDEYLVDGDSQLQALFRKIGDNSEEEEAEQPLPDEGMIVDELSEVDGLCIKRCSVVNSSPGGYHLTWSGEGDTRAHVGELVGIKRYGEAMFLLGVVRWIISNDNQTVEFGVEMFQGEMHPVVVKQIKTLENTIERLRGFIYESSSEAPSIIAPLFYKGQHDKVCIERNAQEIPINIGSTVESSASFIQFHFESLLPEADEEEEAFNESVVNQLDRIDDFDDIWDDIK